MRNINNYVKITETEVNSVIPTQRKKRVRGRLHTEECAATTHLVGNNPHSKNGVVYNALSHMH